MTQIETDAWWGWTYFRSRMESIWSVYAKYGDVVLEKNLEKGDEKFKPLFSQANGYYVEFIKILRDFWEENYHFVANDFTSLVKYLKKQKDNNLQLLPETGNYCDGETKGCDETYSITEELYNRISNLLKGEKTRLKLINYDERTLFEIKFCESESKGSYCKLEIYECHNIIAI